MAFSLPTDLKTNWVDDAQNTTIHASDWNNVSSMGNAIKAALGTIGYLTKIVTTAASETTASTSYTDLTTTTDSVTVAVGSSGMVLLFFRATVTNNGQNYCYVGVDISGATTQAASDTTCIQSPIGTAAVSKMASNMLLLSGLTPGVTTFKLKYKVNAGTGTFANRRIGVIPLPSTDGTHASGAFSLDTVSSVSVGMTGAAVNRPTYDAVGDGYYNASTNTGGSFNHTGASGATPILAVAFGISTNDGVFSASYGGTAMEEIGRVWAAGTGSTGVIFYALKGACDGTQKTVTFTSSKNIDQAITMQCVSYTNVGSFGKPTYATGGASNPSVSATNVPAGGLALNGIQVQRSTAITGYTQTSRFSDARGSYDAIVVGEAAVPSTNGTTITFGATTANNWGSVLLPVLPAAQEIPWDTRSSTVAGSGTKNISSTTFQHTGTNGATPIVAVSVESDNAPFLSSTIACTYNGAAMTLIGYIPTYSTYDIAIALFGKVGACTGSQVDVVVTNSPNAAAIMACCSSYKNVVSFKPPALSPYNTSQPSLSIPSAAGERVVFAGHNHTSGAKGYGSLTGTTRFNDNTYKVSSANPGTTFLADAPADSGSTTAVSAYTSISYGQGCLGAALSKSDPVSIAFDAVGGGATKAGSGTMSWTHNIAGNFLLIYAPYWNTAAFSMSCTVGGVDISSNSAYYTWYNDGSNFIHTRWYWMFDPPQGSQTVVITYSGGGPNRSSANSITYTNVGAMLDPLKSGTAGTTASGSALKMTANGILVCGMSGNFAATAPGTSYSAFNKTQRYSQAGITNVAQPLVIGDTPGSTSDVTFTATQPSCNYGTVIFPLIPTTYA